MQKGNISVEAENIFPIIKQFLYSDQDNTKYSLFNSYGQQVYTGKSSGNNHTINVEVLLPGMYFLYTHNKAAPTEKIFIY